MTEDKNSIVLSEPQSTDIPADKITTGIIPASYDGFLSTVIVGRSQTPTNCTNCGAVLHNGKCEYCGTEY